LPADPAHYPILLSSDPVFDGAQDQIASTDIASLIEGFFLS
jgi:hypothetical protein